MPKKSFIKPIFKIVVLIFMLGITFFSTSKADQALLKNPDLILFIDDMVKKDHFDKKELETIFLNVKPMPEVIHHITHPAESFPWDNYKNLFVTEQRAAKGATFSLMHKALLYDTEKKYHVPSEIIIAILGVESNYGTHTMKYLVLDALSNLAFNYPTRKTFFTSELKSYLELVRQHHLDIYSIYGSYAGAIGPAQFMPDSVQRYAVMTNNDLTLNDAATWIPSIANYFEKKGWHYGSPIVTPIECLEKLPENIIPNSSKHFYSPKILKQAHISNKAEEEAMYLELKSSSGSQCFLAYHNFTVIMRYNTSPLYAMAVTQLSEKIAASFGGI